ncbi:MAG: hypothetical protein JXB32_26405, partial [Deltaproteobacteria bacterium]|nr:hypothetical protein [Deltaproteobacteria bacterium]
EENPPEALLDGVQETHFCQHRLLDSDWRMWLRVPARLVRVTFVQGYGGWDQPTSVRLEVADGSTVDLTLEPDTRHEQSFALDFPNPTAFVDVRVLAVAPDDDDSGWGGFAEVRFDGTPVEPADTTVPAITNVRVEPEGGTAATIRWTTDEPATSQLRYSTETALPQATPPDLAPVTEHAVRIEGTAPLRGYVELRSADAAGNRAERREPAFTTVDTDWTWGVGGWSFHLDGRWRPAPEVFAEDELPLDFVQAWVGGGSWRDWFDADDVRAMVEAGLTPDIIHYYFGDPTRAEVEAGRAAFLEDITYLAQLLADSGVGDRTIVTLEPEFNQDGVPEWDGWNDVALDAMRILRETAGAKVGLLAGDWDIDHLLTTCMGRAAPYSDFVAFQEMRASTQDDPQDALDVVDRAIRFSHWLSRTFLRPVRWGYLMVSDYHGWTELQREVVVELCERTPELRANQVVAVSWMSYLDSPGADGYFGAAEGYKGLKDEHGEGKPAFYVFRECVNHGPTWVESGEWPPGGGPLRGPGCDCRAAGARRPGAGWAALLVVAVGWRCAGRGSYRAGSGTSRPTRRAARHHSEPGATSRQSSGRRS